MQNLKYLFVFIVTLTSSFALAIWNSSDIQKSQYSFVFRFETRMVCSATLLTKNTAITAAHCFSEFTYDTSASKKVRIIDYNGQDIGAVRFKKIIFHPDFDMDTLNGGTIPLEQSAHDIAMIVFSNSDYLNNSTTAFLDKYSLPSSAPKLGQSETLMGLGMGSTTDNGQLAALGGAIIVPNFTGDAVEAILKFKPKGQQSMCPGDSGGPIVKVSKTGLQILGHLSGKVNYRSGSDANNARVCEDDHHYFFVSNYYLQRSWIKSVISNN